MEFLNKFPDLNVWSDVFTPAMGVVYFIAIGSWINQIIPFGGNHGVNPIQNTLSHLKSALTLWKCVWFHPTIFWFTGTSDVVLRGTVVAGMFSALCIVIGQAIPLCFILCWAVHRSITTACPDVSGFPWDQLLSEAGALCMFLSPTPNPVLKWAFRWLMFRLMFGFGKKKFAGKWYEHLMYIKTFMFTQPIPNRASFFAYQYLPDAVFKFLLLGMFITEMIIPFGYFFTGSVRAVCGALTISLMAGIQLTGNFGYFNMLASVLSLTLFDTTASLFDADWTVGQVSKGLMCTG